jgi:hypothetical protein
MTGLLSNLNVHCIHFARKTGSISAYPRTNPQLANESNLSSPSNQFRTGHYLYYTNETQWTHALGTPN